MRTLEIFRYSLTSAAFAGLILFATSNSAMGNEAANRPVSPDFTPTPTPSLFDPNRLENILDFGSPRMAAFDNAPAVTPTPGVITVTEQLMPVRPVVEQAQTPYAEPTETAQQEKERARGNKGNSRNRTGSDNEDNNNNGSNDEKRCKADLDGCEEKPPERVFPTPVVYCTQQYPGRPCPDTTPTKLPLKR